MQRTQGVTAAQLFVLSQVRRSPNLSIQELAALTMTHQSTVSVVAQRLVARGLVRRTPSATDGRRVLLALTPEGRALARRAPDVAQGRLIEALQRLSRRDLRALARGLDHLVREMGMAEEPADMFFEDGRTRD